MRWICVLAVAMAGCAGPQADGPVETAARPYVEIGEGSGFNGGSTFRVYDTGAWTLFTTGPDGSTSRADAASPEAYQAARTAAISGIAALGPISPEACPDYGTDLVVVSTGSGIEAEAAAACPGSGVPEVIRAVREAFAGAASR